MVSKSMLKACVKVYQVTPVRHHSTVLVFETMRVPGAVSGFTVYPRYPIHMAQARGGEDAETCTKRQPIFSQSLRSVRIGLLLLTRV